MVPCLGSCMELAIVSGFLIFPPKYLETQFSLGKLGLYAALCFLDCKYPSVIVCVPNCVLTFFSFLSV